jgi:hypothetical protein
MSEHLPAITRTVSAASACWGAGAAVVGVAGAGPPVAQVDPTSLFPGGQSVSMVGLGVLLVLGQVVTIALSAVERYRKIDEASALGQLRRLEAECLAADKRHAEELARIAEEHADALARRDQLLKDTEKSADHRVNNKLQEIVFLKATIEEMRKDQREVQAQHAEALKQTEARNAQLLEQFVTQARTLQDLARNASDTARQSVANTATV